jgi:chromosome segregation ATPase
LAELEKEQVELEAVKRKIDALEQEIDEVKARVKLLEGKAVRDEEEKEELRQKRPYLTALLSNLDKLRAKEARLEERLQQSRARLKQRFVFRDFLICQ